MKSINNRICLLGGWAVYHSVNNSFFNVGSGKGISINELPETLLRMNNTSGKAVEILYDDP